MISGVDAVKDEIEREFGQPKISERYDAGTFSTVLSFQAEQRTFTVHVSEEFDQDYASGSTIGLESLGPRLRTSKDGKVTVRTTGIA